MPTPIGRNVERSPILIGSTGGYFPSEVGAGFAVRSFFVRYAIYLQVDYLTEQLD